MHKIGHIRYGLARDNLLPGINIKIGYILLVFGDACGTIGESLSVDKL